MADNREKAAPGPSNTGYAVHRREPRHPVHAVYQRYINLQVKINDVFVPVILHEFSGSGILFESQTPLKVKSCVHCVISISQLLTREIPFDIQVKHCLGKNGIFLVGAAVETPADATWFNVFREVHDFIMQRQGMYLE